MTNELVQTSWCCDKDEVLVGAAVYTVELDSCYRHVARAFADVEYL